MRVVHNLDFSLYIHRSEIAKALRRIAHELTEKYHGKEVLFLSVLSGSWIFSADLLRLLDLPHCKISFTKVHSYQGMRSTGKIETLLEVDKEMVRGKRVVLLEDILDSGKTLQSLILKLHQCELLSLEIAVLLYKPSSCLLPIVPDYTGFIIPNRFVIGYGLDYNEQGRQLPDIYCCG